MKIIIEFYAGKNRFDAWLIDTKDLEGKPPVLKIHLYKRDLCKSIHCTKTPK